MIKRIIVPMLVLAPALLLAQDTLNANDINAAGRIIGLQFTSKETAMMLPDLKDNIQDYNKMFLLPLNNSIPMSLAQRLTPDNTPQKKIKWTYDKKIKLPENRNELAFHTIRQLGSLLRNKSITSTELTRFFINRLKQYGDSLQCVVSLTEDLALQQAQEADNDFAKGIDKGPLQGIPYGLKDLFAVKGTKTTWGAQPYRNQIIEEDAYVYQRLKNAGGVLVAKFTLGALAMGDYWFGGRTKNPWNLDRGSSGSSAGSAAATVAGLVPFAIGTETHGSIISPSTTCGATGLRPTFGSISRSGAMTLSWSLDKAGPICRSAEDAAAVFAFLHGTDGLDASAVEAAFNYDSKLDVRQLRIGYAINHFQKLDSSAQEWSILKTLTGLGLDIKPVALPDSESYSFDMIGMVIGSEAAAAFDEFTRTEMDDEMTRQTRNDWPNYFRVSRTIPATAYINTNRHRTMLMKKFNAAMEPFDVVITPSYGGRQLAITNLTGHPALCLPTGLNKNGLPQSITFLANLFHEEELLRLGAFFQENTSFDEMHPPKFK